MTVTSIDQAGVAARGSGPRRRVCAAFAAAALATMITAGCAGTPERAAPVTRSATAVAGAATPVAGAATASCAPARPAPSAAGTQAFRYGGVDRSYLLALPDGYRGTTASPLVFDFHGFGGSVRDQEASTLLAATGTARGYIVVTPAALGDPTKWNILGTDGAADDYGFAHALLTDLTSRLCVDPDRIYAAGHSNGGAFAGLLACRPPFPFAAVALVSGTPPSTCPAAAVAAGSGPSVLAINGTADTTAPYADNVNRLDTFVQSYGCRPASGPTTLMVGVSQRRDLGCAGAGAAGRDIEVDLVTVDGGTHVWPGGPAASSDRPSAVGNSAAGRTFPATQAVLDFFDHHRR
ncbi:alpha/beta hydrolase family esterase [Pseudofrankia sp. EUN1h]|uniref:alpha/beta hydrolase family esterase n=1 Tax=Pseudofrankia sp. EUN1h TaxID=1834515 RepID=UPI0008D8EF87|nr:PHB depolymerase family esterase [Pseudofrankia sp. EUN1h]OHV34749.1 hypothetical protein BCD49_22605 [Pseudofrankia sp. EUN1h]